MKKFILFLAALLSALFASAAYLRDVPVTVPQPDGTVLHCFASGDEYFNYLHDKDGYTIIQHPKTGFYVYADKREGKLIATDFVAGKYNPANKGLQPFASISPEEWSARRKAWHAPERCHQTRDYIPNHGTLNNIAIFIRFSDDSEFTNTFSSIDNMFNDMTGSYGTSMRSYFQAASYGAIDIPTTFYPEPDGDAIISYQDTYPRSFFQPYNASTNTDGYQDDEERRIREFDLLERAATYINSNSMIPSDMNIDYDNDGYVDNVCFIVRGTSGVWSSLLWPHKWSLYDREVLVNGKVVDVYNLQLADDTNRFKTSTMCHEMNHSLSAPDLYHYSGTGPIPIGMWDLMATHTTPPQHCGAYMKMKYGHWIDEIPEITQAGTYTLNPISSATPENIAYKIPTEDPNQFYVLEYRDKNVETALYGSGLLIYRIDTRFYGNEDYDPSSGEYDEVYIFRPDGSFSSQGSLNAAHFGVSNRTEFSASTSPYPFYSEGTLDNNLRIYDIAIANGTVSFTYGTLAECNAPTHLTATVDGRDVTLTWDAADNAQSYRIYREDTFIGTTTNTSFTETELPYGSYNYYIKSVDSEGLFSLASETLHVVICPIPSNLSATKDNTDALLTWSEPKWVYPETPTNILTHGTQTVTGAYFGWGNGGEYWGHRHLAENISSLDGMKLYSVDFYAYNAGVYQLNVLKGTTESDGHLIPTKLLQRHPLTVSASGWYTIDLDHPILIDGEQDLWIFMHDSISISGLRAFVCTASETNGIYYSDDLTSGIYNASYNYAFLIKANLTDGTYTYNLYDNGTLLNDGSPIADTSYTVENIAGNTIHQYTVTTNYTGGESTPSNIAYLAIGTHSLNNLSLENDRMNITEGSTLSVSGSLTCTDPDHLILEDGAQLINDSEGVKATVKKNIQPYTEGKRDGWNLIASPIIESITPTVDNGLLTNEYDLYMFDQSEEKEWRNYEANPRPFSIIDNGFGYLYANSDTQTLSFAGTLAANVDPTPLIYDENAYFAGFNLIGNPYPCNAYLDRPFYVLEYKVESDSTQFFLGDNPIAPCTAVLVQTQSSDDDVTFSKEQLSQPSKIAIRLSQADQKSATEIDQVRIMFQQHGQLSKYPQRGSASTIYIPKNGKKLAVASAEGLTELPINLRTTKNGTYTLNIETEKVDLAYLHLIDNMTGDDVDLLALRQAQGPTSYTFEANTKDYESRFKLVFVCEDANDDNETFAFVSNGNIIVTGEGMLQIVDITGRIILSGDAKHCVSTTGMTPGVYVLRLINGDIVKTQKIIIE